MKSNGLLKWLMIPAILIVLVIGFKVFSGGKNTSLNNDDTPRLTADEMKALGIEGDTPRDTVATLVGQVKQLRAELKTALDDNKTQRSENERLRQRERDIDQRIKAALNDEREKLRQERDQNAEDKRQTQTMLSTLQQRIDGIGNDIASKPAVELPIGLGLEGPAERLKDEIIWIEPADAQPVDPRTSSKPGVSFPSSFSTVDASGQSLYAGEKIRHEAYSERQNAPEPKPVYTVPANATLVGSVAMTALIGRVPVDGTVNDPYPFKVLIGPDNLTANGIELPDVAGAVLSGTATGDWTLSCVRGQITSMTFVFHDGTIRTVPASNTNNTNNRNNTNALGWLSDPHGIPCVSGERRSNAAQYLTSQALITAAGAGAASLIKNEGGNISYASSDGSIGNVGITGNEAMGRILSNGVQDMSAWVNKLYGQAFAAVYVQPGAQVVVHIEREIGIDYDSVGRKVDHTIGVPHANNLD